MKKIGITGYRGRLGSYLTSHFPFYVPLDCDVTLPERVKECMRSERLDGVLHLAAKSDVDWCEKVENSKEVSLTNLRGTFNVCVAAENMDIPVTLLSSDHVFSGKWGRYKETDIPNPINQYGRSKLAAESLRTSFGNLRIIRTSYFYDADRILSKGSGSYPTFIVRTFLHINRFGHLLNEYFSAQSVPPILHLSGSRACSWYTFMTFINEKMDLGWNISPRRREEPGHAPRPRSLALDTSLSRKLGFSSFSYLDGLPL